VLRPYDLLENILVDVEKGITAGVDVVTLADKYALSDRHIRRLFKFAFNQSLAGYIRSRRLTASIDDLLKNELNILDIALEYGFDYEQSYIVAFKREFGMTPGELRKSRQIVKVTPPLHLFDSNRLGDGLIFGPDMVMVPQFHVAGKKLKLPFRDELVWPESMEKQFQIFQSERPHIPNTINPHMVTNISFQADDIDADYCWFMPVVQVKSLEHIPDKFDRFTFPTSLCARFRFIGNYTFDEINMHIADGMFIAIDNFMDSEDQQYFLERKELTLINLIRQIKMKTISAGSGFRPLSRKHH